MARLLFSHHEQRRLGAVWKENLAHCEVGKIRTNIEWVRDDNLREKAHGETWLQNKPLLELSETNLMKSVLLWKKGLRRRNSCRNVSYKRFMRFRWLSNQTPACPSGVIWIFINYIGIGGCGGEAANGTRNQWGTGHGGVVTTERCSQTGKPVESNHAQFGLECFCVLVRK